MRNPLLLGYFFGLLTAAIALLISPSLPAISILAAAAGVLMVWLFLEVFYR